MSEQDDLEKWAAQFTRKIPGSSEPMSDKCAAKIRDKDLKELGIDRYCTKRKGMGTSHLDEGRCKFHGGSTATHKKSAETAMVIKQVNELTSISAKLGDAAPIGPPEVEAFQLASKAKQWLLILEQEMDKLGGYLVNEDMAGIEHTRAIVELMERAMDRLQRYLEFAMKHDLNRRVVELEEQQAAMIGAAFMAVILSQDLKLTENQIKTARNMFAKSMNDLGESLTPTWSASMKIKGEEDYVEAEIVD